jgi:hypothetical protein
VVKNIGVKTGKVLEVRGLPGNSVDRDRHLGFRKVRAGHKFEIVEVVGNWDDGTAQKGGGRDRRAQAASTACSCRPAPPERCAR